MKRMKNLLSLVLALVMVMAMTLTAMATEALPGETGKELNLNSHTYVAYQIFKGTQNETVGDAALGQIEWGSGVKSGELLSALQGESEFEVEVVVEDVSQKVNAFLDAKSAADVAKVISEHQEWALKIAKIINEHLAEGAGTTLKLNEETSELAPENGSVLEAGYYLIADETEFEEGSTDTVTNLSLLQLTKDGNFEAKVKTDIPSVTKKVYEDANEDWQDVADYGIEEEIPFRLTGTLPADYATYTSYKYVFHDTMSLGLTFSGIEKVKVTINDVDVKGYYTVNSSTLGDDSTELTITIENLKKLEENYNKDHSNAPIEITKDSKIVVEYSATLNDKAKVSSEANTNEVYLEYSNNPNNTDEGETGNTPPDTVFVFTYSFNVNKVDEEDNSLEGAEFKLYKQVAEDSWVEAGNYTLTEGTHFTWKGLDEGVYKLEETIVPAGYNKIDDIEFKVVRTFKSDEGSSADAVQPETLTVQVKDENGDWKDSNDYKCYVNASKVDETTNIESNIDTNIANKKGVTLPETGGIGTTIFTVSGIILVIIAGVLLVTKKRMSKEE